MDLLGGGLDSLLGGGGMEPAGGASSGGDLFSAGAGSSAAGLGEIFGLGAVTAAAYVPPQEVSLIPNNPFMIRYVRSGWPGKRVQDISGEGSFEAGLGEISLGAVTAAAYVPPQEVGRFSQGSEVGGTGYGYKV